jgi:hypothetical protein
MLACSPKSAGRGRFELESRVSSAGRAVYHPNAKGLDAYICTYGRLVPLRVPRQVETAWSRLVRVVRLAPDRSPGLRGGMRRMGATCADAQTHMHSRRIPSQEYDRNGAESGGAVAFPSEWRPLLRSDRLLGLPAADRQSLGCSPAIEGPSPRYPPKHARFSGRMSGSRRETHLATKLGELVADGARTREKCAKTMHRVHAAEACSFCAESRAGRSIPATCGKRVPAEGEGEMPRGRACVGSRRTYSSTGPPAGPKSESAGRDRWPPPSDKVTKRSYEKNESVVHATPLART